MLTDKDYWNKYHIKKKDNSRNPLIKILESIIRRLLNENYLNYMRTAYSSYFFWDFLLDKYLKNHYKLKVIEIGSAPGDRLIKLKEKFNLIPFGVEYSEIGLRRNRENFLKYNLDPESIIFADFFSKDFQNKYLNYFDIVFSWGFIEHFSNVEKVINCHLDILRKNGILIIVIPNIRGLNLALARFFLKESIAKHNITIMKKNNFQNLFNKKKLEMLYCNYFGVFNIHLFYTNKNGIKASFLKIMKTYIRPILNFLFRVLFKDKGFESPYISPYLVFIGIKK
ncbi:MAG: class I SAM-dependent methyltransferase [Promethearchaeota archaeon]